MIRIQYERQGAGSQVDFGGTFPYIPDGPGKEMWMNGILFMARRWESAFLTPILLDPAPPIPSAIIPFSVESLS